LAKPLARESSVGEMLPLVTPEEAR
jgi:hypothetical protein